MANKKVADEIAEMIQSRIEEHEEAIRLLTIELSRYTNPKSEKKAATSSSRKESSGPSIKNRVIRAIGETMEPYSLAELRKLANSDGGKEINKPTFTSTHSRLVGEYCKLLKQDSSNKPAYYIKNQQEV